MNLILTGIKNLATPKKKKNINQSDSQQNFGSIPLCFFKNVFLKLINSGLKKKLENDISIFRENDFR